MVDISDCFHSLSQNEPIYTLSIKQKNRIATPPLHLKNSKKPVFSYEWYVCTNKNGLNSYKEYVLMNI